MPPTSRPHQISKDINIDASQIAKDLSFVNISGRTRVGYEVDTLIAALEDFLGFTALHKAFLFGVGSLGGALLRDSGLKHFGLEIVAAFDVKPSLVGTSIEGIPIFHTDELAQRMSQYHVPIGVLTVPIEIAQEITDKMVEGEHQGRVELHPLPHPRPRRTSWCRTHRSTPTLPSCQPSVHHRPKAMKILAAGMNYARHNKEAGCALDYTEPIIFTKPDSALLRDGKPFFLPQAWGEISYEAEVVVHICRLGRHIAPRFARRYYDAATVASTSRPARCNAACAKAAPRGNCAKGSTARHP